MLGATPYRHFLDKLIMDFLQFSRFAFRMPLPSKEKSRSFLVLVFLYGDF